VSRNACSEERRVEQSVHGHHRHVFHGQEANHSHCNHVLTDGWEDHQLCDGTKLSAVKNGDSTCFLWDVPPPPAPPSKKHIGFSHVAQGEACCVQMKPFIDETY
jgi:hypothetical protein